MTLLIVKHCHEKVSHNGTTETLTELHSKFWIIRGRQFVRKVIHKCVLCRRHDGKSYRPPDPLALPPLRVTEHYPFSYTVVDFAGPQDVKKVYIALFTCAVSRAVHLDIVPDLTAEAFLRCFRRFTARRGVPLEIRSDNGKTFKSAAKTLSTLFDSSEVKSHLTLLTFNATTD